MDEAQKMMKEIMDECMVQVARQMLSLELKPVDGSLDDLKEYNLVIASIKGSYEMTMVMAAEKSLFRMIAEHMSRGRATECDISEYAIEYFNVLCGRIISIFNRRMKTAYRFKVPVYKEDLYLCSTKLELGVKNNYMMENGKKTIILGIYQ